MPGLGIACISSEAGASLSRFSTMEIRPYGPIALRFLPVMVFWPLPGNALRRGACQSEANADNNNNNSKLNNGSDGGDGSEDSKSVIYCHYGNDSKLKAHLANDVVELML